MNVNSGLNVGLVFSHWILADLAIRVFGSQGCGIFKLIFAAFYLMFFFFFLLAAYSLLPLCVYIRGGNVAAGGPGPKSAVYTF